MSSQYIPIGLRRLVTERAGYRCEYCGTPVRFSAAAFTCDHLTPHSLGGLTTADNLAYACYSCNQHKAARTVAFDPITASDVPLFNPRSQRWDEHFAWDETFTTMLGLTPVGRATIEALQLNREGLVNLRHVLYLVGERSPLS